MRQLLPLPGQVNLPGSRDWNTHRPAVTSQVNVGDTCGRFQPSQPIGTDGKYSGLYATQSGKYSNYSTLHCQDSVDSWVWHEMQSSLKACHIFWNSFLWSCVEQLQNNLYLLSFFFLNVTSANQNQLGHNLEELKFLLISNFCRVTSASYKNALGKQKKTNV